MNFHRNVKKREIGEINLSDISTDPIFSPIMAIFGESLGGIYPPNEDTSDSAISNSTAKDKIGAPISYFRKSVHFFFFGKNKACFVGEK